MTVPHGNHNEPLMTQTRGADVAEKSVGSACPINKEENMKAEETKETKELAIIEILREPMALADVFVKSGMFPDLKTQCQAVVKIIAGREYGLTPLQAVTELYMVNGRVAMSAKLIAAAIKKSFKYDYHIDKMDNEECVISFYEITQGKDVVRTKLGESIFTIKDAARAGIVNKDVWKNYPKQMLYSRAISMGGRSFCPDIITAYTPEEAEDTVTIPTTGTVIIDEQGEVVNG